MALVDDERTLVEVNPAFCALVGRPSEELIGLRLDELLVDDSRHAILRSWGPSQTGRQPEHEMSLTRPDGETRVFEHRVTFGVGVGRHLSTLRDVTEERRATARLQDATARFERAFHHAPIGMALTSMEEGDAGRPLAVNQRFAEIFGYREDELLAVDPVMLSHPGDLDVGLDEARRLLSGELDSYGIEKRFIRKDGATVWARVQVSLVRSSRPYAVVQVEDITHQHEAAAALQESEERFRRLAENAEDVVFLFRMAPEPGFEYLSPSVETLTGYSAAELYADPGLYSRIVHPDDAHLLEEETGWFGKAVSLRWIRKDGEIIWTEQRVVAIHDDAGHLAAVQGIVRDITERREIEEELERLARIVRTSDDAIVSIDEHGMVSSWNPGAERLYGYKCSEALGRPIDELIVPAPFQSTEPLPWRRALGGETVIGCEAKRRTKHGQLVDVSITVSPLRSRDGALIGASHISRDVTQRKRMEQALRHHAEHDGLTDLMNRRRFEEVLEAVVSRDKPATLAVIDIDHFKAVNDSRGHGVGDQLLCSVARALCENTRETDVVARLGGDEFAVLAPGVDGSRAEALALELAARVSDHGAAIPVTASVGVAVFRPHERVSGHELMVAADAALHEAKEQGRDRVSVSRGRSAGSFAWVREVREAVDDGRLVLYSQPILDLRSEEITQRELLVRMRDSRGRLVGPAEFLPVAERFDLISAVDRWVVSQAVRMASERDAGRGGLHVNLSGRSMSNAKLLDAIAAEVSAADLRPEALVFEITETAAIANLDQARDFVSLMRDHGCPVALDDFGTGFGSFTYLKYLPVTHVKIDMEFVRGLSRSPDDQSIVRAIVDVAHAKGIETVAEGVEDEETLALLRAYDVGFAQGFYIGRPAECSP